MAVRSLCGSVEDHDSTPRSPPPFLLHHPSPPSPPLARSAPSSSSPLDRTPEPFPSATFSSSKARQRTKSLDIGARRREGLPLEMGGSVRSVGRSDKSRRSEVSADSSASPSISSQDYGFGTVPSVAGNASARSLSTTHTAATTQSVDTVSSRRILEQGARFLPVDGPDLALARARQASFACDDQRIVLAPGLLSSSTTSSSSSLSSRPRHVRRASAASVSPIKLAFPPSERRSVYNSSNVSPGLDRATSFPQVAPTATVAEPPPLPPSSSGHGLRRKASARLKEVVGGSKGGRATGNSRDTLSKAGNTSRPPILATSFDSISSGTPTTTLTASPPPSPLAPFVSDLSATPLPPVASFPSVRVTTTVSALNAPPASLNTRHKSTRRRSKTNSPEGSMTKSFLGGLLRTKRSSPNLAGVASSQPPPPLPQPPLVPRADPSWQRKPRTSIGSIFTTSHPDVAQLAREGARAPSYGQSSTDSDTSLRGARPRKLSNSSVSSSAISAVSTSSRFPSSVSLSSSSRSRTRPPLTLSSTRPLTPTAHSTTSLSAPDSPAPPSASTTSSHRPFTLAKPPLIGPFPTALSPPPPPRRTSRPRTAPTEARSFGVSPASATLGRRAGSAAIEDGTPRPTTSSSATHLPHRLIESLSGPRQDEEDDRASIGSASSKSSTASFARAMVKMNSRYFGKEIK